MLQYLPIIITALLGLFGLVAKTKKDDKPGYLNKLTPFGVIVLLLLISSFVVAIWLQNDRNKEIEEQKRQSRYKAAIDSLNERHRFELDSMRYRATIANLQKQVRDDSIRFDVTLSKFSEQLKSQNKTLFNILKISHPIRNFEFSYQIEVSFKNSMQYQDYIHRISSSIDSLLPFLQDKHNKVIDGVRISSWTGNTPTQFSIDRTSKLYPMSNGEEESIYLFFMNVHSVVHLFKVPVNIQETQFYVRPASFEEARSFKNPDLGMDFAFEEGEENEVYFDRFSRKIIIKGNRLRTDSKEWQTNGKITSILDLARGQIFFEFRNLEPELELTPSFFVLEIPGQVQFLFTPDEIKTHKRLGQVFFECSFSRHMEYNLSNWNE